jgi:hypothetical protein
MKKLSFILAAFLVCGAMQAQISFDFEDGTLQGWTTIDADGDGHNWQQQSANGMSHNNSDGMVLSYSKEPVTGDSLAPNNFLVSPRLTLAPGSYISLWAYPLDESRPAEHWAICVSTTANDDPMAFTTLQEWTLTGNPFHPGEWTAYYVDLDQYAGQDVYIAIRHFFWEGFEISQSAICIDDIYIEGAYDRIEEEAKSVGIYPNPAKDRVVIEGMEAVEVMVYNTSGQMMKTVRGTNEIDLSTLPKGFYSIRIFTDEGTIVSKKIVVE